MDEETSSAEKANKLAEEAQANLATIAEYIKGGDLDVATIIQLSTLQTNLALVWKIDALQQSLVAIESELNDTNFIFRRGEASVNIIGGI